MEETDDFLRWLLLASGALLTATYVLGSLFTRVAGFWQDQGRRVRLQQFGPLVWGESLWPGGRQVFRGRATWGHLRLRRVDFGAEHLKALGFSDEQVPLLEGQITAHLKLKLKDGKLAGKFYGRKFSFKTNAIKSVAIVAPVQRTWARYTGADNED